MNNPIKQLKTDIDQLRENVLRLELFEWYKNDPEIQALAECLEKISKKDTNFKTSEILALYLSSGLCFNEHGQLYSFEIEIDSIYESEEEITDEKEFHDFCLEVLQSNLFQMLIEFIQLQIDLNKGKSMF
jgi:hypothetical protein